MMSFSRLKSAVTAIAILFALTLSGTRAATITHYLLIQANFTNTTAGLETYKFKVTYDSSLATKPLTGYDLLSTVFGAPVVAGGTPAAYGYYSTPNASFGVKYQYFSGLGYSPQQFFINGLNGPESLSVFPYDYWNYLAAGGTAANNESGTFANGVWTYSENDGAATRYLADGSYDAWTFGNAYPDYIDVEGVANSPTSPNFSDLTQLLFTANGISVYAATPEPGRLLLLALGVSLVIFRRQRQLLGCALNA